MGALGDLATSDNTGLLRADRSVGDNRRCSRHNRVTATRTHTATHVHTHAHAYPEADPCTYAHLHTRTSGGWPRTGEANCSGLRKSERLNAPSELGTEPDPDR